MGFHSFFILSLCFISLLAVGSVFRVTPIDYRTVTDKVMKANAELIKEVVKRKCEISVDFSGNGSMKIFPEIENESQVPARICVIHQGDPKKPALLGHVNTFTYLRTKETWFGFLNKAYFATKNDRSFYLWVGTLQSDSRPTHESTHDTVKIPWFKCFVKHRKTDYIHPLKILSILALYEIPNPPLKVIYLDADLFLPFKEINPPFSVIEQYLDAPTVFLTGNIGGNKGLGSIKLFNSAHIGTKNNEETKRLLGLW
eukprot:CAMPEP_0201515130 /NCGR_PEP_ID=MMETSP0161_2-20130828/6778_1 /ASSEMBLY_ACC=CAM_ASM_000251 /TAXON_ID=180227 /ORGANISM="Neoparamoeba aestuarina, Strain SoJaBio B1-5/56/2" /LENGTH=255 /DNA_ID=CAMNT_0047911869 /DNA_START=38 /DNA_END=802 /DNA_ORIENTATION=-